jgi:hypothetical protein
MPNHLIHESSPYLLQHANNPVDWYPWGEAALEKARLEDKPILLSIGYAACHWCHVMAHESFENETIARMMNEWFINIKVDREERPDLDSIYMQAVVALTGQGGWPMTVFLTPQGEPFFGGTYFPPLPRYGMPAFSQVLQSVAAAWRQQRHEVNQSAEQIMAHLKQASQGLMGQDSRKITASLVEASVQVLAGRFDARWGGFSPAPKFPQPMVIEFLLREYVRSGNASALNMAEVTLEKMARGGMYDHLGGGFARYSTDPYWLVPHFEKMLYDNAQLARVYLHAWQITRKSFYRQVVEETLDFLQREMTHPEGGFFSSQDADSEGEEGKFYTWSKKEIERLLGEEADLFARVYDVTDYGNWEGKNILHLAVTPGELALEMGLGPEEIEARLKACRQKLYTIRQQRIHPGLDDKVLVSWNGLALAVFAEAGSVLERMDYLDTAVRNARFIYDRMRAENGRLFRTWRAGSKAKLKGFLEDYAFLANGLLALYQANFDPFWFIWARELADKMIHHFQDPQNGGFYDTPDDHELLVQRPKDLEDNAIPSGNASAAHVLFKLGMFTGEDKYPHLAEASLSLVSGFLGRYPFGFGEWLGLVSLSISQPVEVALVGTQDEIQPFLQTIHMTYRPFLVLAAGPGSGDEFVPLLRDRIKVNVRPSAYICRQFVCQAPVTEPQGMAELLK